TRKGKPGNDGIKRHAPATAGVQWGDGGGERRATYFGQPDWAPAFAGEIYDAVGIGRSVSVCLPGERRQTCGTP
ncbi:hypothetical protein NY536_27875, partial [Enterobacter hormaechei]|nr:hypothetical protein [Enterobacter hormaechei]